MRSPSNPNTRWVGLTVFLFAFAVYAPSIWFEYVHFDGIHLLQQYRSLYDGPFLEAMGNIFTQLPREEPLFVRDLSWLIDSRVFGYGNPFGYHLINVILNAGQALLASMILSRIFARKEVVVTLSLLYVLVPVRAEPVATVMGRKDLLSTLFMLFGIICWDSFLRTRRPLPYALSLAAVPLAMLSKISALALGPILLLWAWSRRRSGEETHQYLHARGYLPALVPHALFTIVITAWYHQQLAAWGNLGRGPEFAAYLPVWLRLAPVAFVENLKVMASPFQHVIFYQFPSVGLPISVPYLVFCWSVTLGFLAFTLWLLVRRKTAGAMFAAYLVQMLPYMNLEYIGIWVADRYLLLPSLWILAGLGCLFVQATEAEPRIARGLRAGVVCVGLFWLLGLVLQLPKYHDQRTLHEHQITLPDPPIHSFRDLASLYLSEAEERPEGDPARAWFLERALFVIDEGIETFESLGFVDDRRFSIHPIHYYSNLLHFKGRAVLLTTGSKRDAVEWMRKAKEIVETDSVNLTWLVVVLADWASEVSGPERQAHLRASFGHFETLVNMNPGDVSMRPRLLALLERAYEDHFESHRERLEAYRRFLER
ncbi:MAG: hypothetical protein ACFB9M_02765 [Myxococcota bacterium]